jgi:hypothetical protein
MQWRIRAWGKMTSSHSHRYALIMSSDKIRTMKTALGTEPELSEVLAELSRREPIFHRPEFGTSRADFKKMTVEDFWEVGASGRRYSRKEVLDALEKRCATPYEDVWETFDFHCRKLADDVFLLTYTLIQDKRDQEKSRRTRRSTIWKRTVEGWKIAYHQGTIVQDS